MCEDECLKYQKPLKLSKIKMIFKWRWIQNLPWLYFLILFHALWMSCPHFLFILLVVPIIYAYLQSLKRNIRACITMPLEFLLSTNIYWGSTLCQICWGCANEKDNLWPSGTHFWVWESTEKQTITIQCDKN